MSSLDPALVSEGARIMTICNACRYCEGYCAVFPAMERRLSFTAEDLTYLADLCHNCGECLPACQYAPPHEFAVNVPLTLSEIRSASHRYTFGAPAAAIACAIFVLATLIFVKPPVLFTAHDGGAFFAVISHFAMVTLFGAAGLYAAIMLGLTVRRRLLLDDGGAVISGVSDALTLVNLRGARRFFHHLMFYGFLACFAATIVAAFYDNILGRRAPYALTSVPVILGTLGGLAIVAGGVGLLALIARRDPAMTDSPQRRRDISFTVLLLLVAVTGLLLLLLRASAAMGMLLSVHLGLVLGLFVTMPYGKFIHGFYHVAALIRYAHEDT